MYIWVKPEVTGDYSIAFDEPDELEFWLVLTTREMHYKTICEELMRQAKQYDLEKRPTYARVARDLANTLSQNNTKVN